MSRVNGIEDRKYGMGTLALIISIFGIMVSFTYIGGKTIAQHILGPVQSAFPSSIISIILFTLAGTIGYKHKEDYGELGKKYIFSIYRYNIVYNNIKFYFLR